MLSSHCQINSRLWPSHVPYSVPKRLSNRVEFFHLSWISVLTQAALILRDNEEISSANKRLFSRRWHAISNIRVLGSDVLIE